eukprot:CAMPEP_0180421306 /NCGR_PEP_ID=MMETSP1036_2-20121128/3082_1 /TAXON_ID=632150 /ORGANISM="Azadinium spinosum, Strain 3D9" /LENGTH=110 /DNA_ID=CAMNT_0022426565 /DNA_START=791 /DNA_END=1123 /DNA_ORIENTATION=+
MTMKCATVSSNEEAATNRDLRRLSNIPEIEFATPDNSGTSARHMVASLAFFTTSPSCPKRKFPMLSVPSNIRITPQSSPTEQTNQMLLTPPTFVPRHLEGPSGKDTSFMM